MIKLNIFGFWTGGWTKTNKHTLVHLQNSLFQLLHSDVNQTNQVMGKKTPWAFNY